MPSVAFDQGPSGFDGTYDATATLGRPGSLTNDPDTSVEFPGTTNGVVIADVLDFTGTAPYSLEAWVKPLLIDVNSRAFCGKKSLTDEGYSLFVNDTGTGFGRYNGSMSEAYGAPIATNVFSHVVGTFDGSILTLYINGTTAATQVNAIVLPDRTVAFAIGAKGEGTPGFFDGSIDEVAVYDRALTAAEVTAHHTAGTQ